MESVLEENRSKFRADTSRWRNYEWYLVSLCVPLFLKLSAILRYESYIQKSFFFFIKKWDKSKNEKNNVDKICVILAKKTLNSELWNVI